MGSLFQELKRRKVFRVAVVYAVVAWAIIQIADTIAPMMNLPESAPRLVLFLLIILFPIALFLAWAYEVTPEGVKLESGASSRPAAAPATDRYLIYATFTLVLLVAGFQFSDRFFGSAVAPLANGVDGSSGSIANTGSNQVLRSIVPLGESSRWGGAGALTLLALSRDGSQLAYNSFDTEIVTDVRGGRRQVQRVRILLRKLDQLEASLLVDDLPHPSDMAFSPDGQWLAYTDGGELMKVPVAGGPPQRLVLNSSNQAEGLFWSRDDQIYMTEDGQIGRVSASGGTFQSLNIPFQYGEQEWQAWPHVLPGNEALLFTRSRSDISTDVDGDLYLHLLGENNTQLLIPNAYNASYSPSGHLLFSRQGDLWAVPFEIETLRVVGPELIIQEDLEGVGTAGMLNYKLSSEGRLVYLVGGNAQQITLTGARGIISWVDRDGKETPLEMVPQLIANPRLSPDGSRVAVTVGDRNIRGSDIWIYDLTRQTFSRVTFSEDAYGPLWSWDGERIYFSNPGGIHTVNANGIGNIETLLPASALTSGWLLNSSTADGTMLLLQQDKENDVIDDIQAYDFNREQLTTPLLDSAFFEANARISPNGKWLAYVVDETGEFQVYVRPYPDVNSGKWMISRNGGGEPMWAEETGELFYRRRTDDPFQFETYVVSIAEGEAFSAGEPELLFTSDHDYRVPGNYQVSADGQRLLMIKPVERRNLQTTYPRNLVLVENFATELRRIAPASGN